MLKRKKVLSIILEIIALAILTIAAYYGAIKLIFAFPYSRLFPYIFFISLIFFDFIYICSVKFWPLKNIHIKIIVRLPLFAFSTADVTFFIFASMFVMP
jgi:hypothetical protein